MMTTSAPPLNHADEVHGGGGGGGAPRPAPRLPTRAEVLACQFHSWYGAFRNIADPDDAAGGESRTGGDGADNGGGAAADGHRRPAAASGRRRRRRRRLRRNVTIESAVLPLPPDFVEYLLSDGVRLPVGATELSSCAPADGDGDGWSSSSDEDDDDDDEGDGDDDGDDEASDGDGDGDEGDARNQYGAELPRDGRRRNRRFAFPDLNESVSAAIERLGGGGGVLPKLNWSAPRDAAWMNGGSMRCRTPGDVYLLLKSSDFVVHDVLHAFDGLAPEEEGGEGGTSPDGGDGADGGGGGGAAERYLVLRRWCNLHPSMEFRCFVRNGSLVAVSQRNHTQRYPHLSSAAGRRGIRSLLVDFFATYVRGRYAGGAVSDYVFDAYVDESDRVWLLDFNVWGTRTDPLLFDWEELAAMEPTSSSSDAESDQGDDGGGGEGEEREAEDDEEGRGTARPEMRVVTAEMEVRHDPLASYRAPIDAVDLAAGGVGGGGRAAKSFEEFMAMCERPSERGG